jgi:hypothetical protein
MLIGVDPHKTAHTATALDPATNSDRGSVRIDAGYAERLHRRPPRRRVSQRCPPVRAETHDDPLDKSAGRSRIGWLAGSDPPKGPIVPSSGFSQERGHDLCCTDEFCGHPSSIPIDTPTSVGLCWDRPARAEHTEAMMSVDDPAQEQMIRAVIRTGEQGAQ